MDFPGEFLIWLIFQSALPALIIFQDWARSGSKRSMIKKSYFWGKEIKWVFNGFITAFRWSWTGH